MMAGRKDYPINNDLWAPMATAPKEGVYVDLWAKTWLADADSFIYDRFPKCYWSNGDHTSNVRERWVNLPKEWHPVAWYRVPHPAAQP
jgi:hypothetical protein